MTEEYPVEVQPTNRVRYIVLKKDGTTENIDGGKVAGSSDIPIPGDGHLIGSKGYQVGPHLYTPHLPFSWNVLLHEL
ncbi:hypothetical protein ACU4I5_18680 [Ensifer adhaerens]